MVSLLLQLGPPPGVLGGRRAPVENPVNPQPQWQPPATTQPAPEEEPTPEYNAPPSFWDQLMGDGKGK